MQPLIPRSIDSDPGEEPFYPTGRGLLKHSSAAEMTQALEGTDTDKAKRDCESPVPAMMTSHGASESVSILTGTKVDV